MNRGERRRQVKEAGAELSRMKRQARRIVDPAARREALEICRGLERLEGDQLVSELEELRRVPLPGLRYGLIGIRRLMQRRKRRSSIS